MKIIKYIFGAIGLFIGVIFLGIGFLVLTTTKIDKINRVNTTAEIVSIEIKGDYHSGHYTTTYDVLVQYDVDGVTYVSELDSYSSEFYEGQKIDVCYDRNDYSVVMYEDIEETFYIFPIIGFIIVGISLLLIIDEWIKSSRIKRIEKKGELVRAKYIGLETIDKSIIRKHKIVCEWENPENGERYIFKSKPLYYYYLEDIITKNKIEYFEVRFLKRNPKKYIINTKNIWFWASGYRPEDTNQEYELNIKNDFVEDKVDKIKIENDNPIDVGFNLSNDDVIKYK